MGQALYRDYRPKSFEQVVGQDHITATLQKAIKNGRISHAYLFTGPHGVGKTSVARILAHEINGLPYTDDAAHLDIIEIDAASNRRIDEIRELRDKVHVSPTSAKYKVYIIDEVHMLTREAFNALLKTLEEPPAHVIFILATTEAHKLPETIVSRTQRFEFKPIGLNVAQEHLAHIAKSEKINADPKALALLAEHGEGSFRDSISLLDQLRSGSGAVSEQDVADFLGLPPAALINDLMNAIESGQSSQVIDVMDKLRASSANTTLVARMLAKQARQKLIGGANQAWLSSLLLRLIEVPASFSPEDSLEIAALEACSANAGKAPVETMAAPAPAAVTSAPAKAPAKKIGAEEAPAEVKSQAAPVARANFDEQAWEQIIEKVKSQAASLYTALRLATPQAKDGTLTLAFQFPLHQKKVDQSQHKALIAKVVAEVTGQDMSVEPVVSQAKPVAKKEKPAKKDEPLSTISNIFGKPEVLES